MPRSPTGSTSGRSRWNIRNICARPQAETLDGDELGDHLLVGQLVQALELELAGEHVLGERAQEADLRAREARGGAQLFGLVGEDLLRRRRAPPKRAVRRP